MGNFCIFTGTELVDGVPLIKKMCLNCKSLVKNEDETYVCVNETVMEKGKEKILAAVPEGYEIDTLTLKPMLLKNPTKKCSVHETCFELLYQELNNILL